jgi:Fe2+ or Zn2+ uptake regulation protein
VVQNSIRILQAKGYKTTKPRKLVLEVLEEMGKPLSPYDIQGILHARGKYLNHVTIYRILNLLCNLNLAHKMQAAIGSWFVSAAEPFKNLLTKDYVRKKMHSPRI